MTNRIGTHRIGVLILPPVIGYDAVIPPQVFGVANDALGTAAYDVTMIGLGGAPVQSYHGYAMTPESDESALGEIDTLIVPGTVMPGPRFEGSLRDDLAAALALVRPQTRKVSICTGAFVLAAAGILNGRPATTHWAKAAEFRSLYPEVLLDPNVLFVDDGDVLTSAGLSAGVDLCLHLLRREVGSEVANEVARYLVVPPWREGGQAQYIDRADADGADLADAGLSTAATREWAQQRLAERLSVADMAAHAHMSVRTFARRFRAETGMPPATWVIQQRVRAAEQLLETTDLPVDVVAERAGLGSGSSLRQHLRRTAGVGPAAYRRTFRGSMEQRY